MKFKEGDRVRAKTNSNLEHGRYAGRGGIVDYITLSKKYPYSIKLSGKHLPVAFSEDELKKPE